MSERVMKADFKRPITIYCCKDGSITYGRRGVVEDKEVGAAVPVFSVDTVEEAKQLQTMLCSKGFGAMVDRMVYDKPNYACVPEDLPEVYLTFKAAHKHDWPAIRERTSVGTEDFYVRREANLYKERPLRDRFRENLALEGWLKRIGAHVRDRVIR